MAENYVEILVKSRDEAKPDLDALRAKLDELSHTVATARAKVDDKDAAEKLDRMQAKLLDLDHRTANPKIRMSGAIRAEADIHAIELSMDRLQKKADSSGKRGLIGRMLLGAAADSEGGGGGGGGLLGALPDFLSNPYALAGIAGGVAALLPELTAVVSGLAAAGAGVGAFGVLAIPTLDKIKTAYTNISTAQTNYNNAVALNKEDPTKAHAAAAAAALEKLRVAQESMGPSTRDAVNGIHDLMKTYDEMAKAFQPVVMKVFNDGLKLANDLLPALKPMAAAAGGALDGLLKDAGKFAQSKGFKEWLGQFDKLIGPSITAIGHGIGNVVTNIGKLFTTMSKQDVVNGINIAFRILSGTITGIIGIVKGLMVAWDVTSKAVVQGWHDIRQWTLDTWHVIDQVIHNIEHAYDNWEHAGGNLTHAFGNVEHFISTAMTDIQHAVQTGITAVIGFFKALPGRILGALGDLGHLLWNAGAAVIHGLIGGVESAVGGLLSTIKGIAGDISGAFKSVLSIFSPSKVFEEHGRNIVRGLVRGINGEGPTALAAIRRLGGQVGGGLGGGYGGGGGGAQLHITGAGAANFMALVKAIWPDLRMEIRTVGGGGTTSVQRALGFQH